MLWCSLEALHQSASSEYPQHVSWRNEKNIITFLVEKKKQHMIWCYAETDVQCLKF